MPEEGINSATWTPFGPSIWQDSTTIQPILINESQAAAFGWTPEEAINQFVNFNGRQVRIQGSCRTFHFASLHVPIENLVVFPDYYGQDILVRVNMQDLPATLQYMESAWQEVVGHRPFSFHFMSEEIGAMYHAEDLIARMITTLTGIAIFMTVIGLFGLVAISTQHRTKEIGIRKVLGASVMGIIGMLSSDMLKLTAMALLVSAPFAYLVMQGWLSGLAYRIGMPWGVYVGAGVLAFLITVLTVSSQSLKTVLTNPVQALRQE